VNRCIRSVFLTLGSICFLAMTSGVTLYLHLAHVDNPAEHDAAHCSLCQQLVVSKKNYTVDFEPADIEIDSVGHLVSACPALLFCQSLPSQFHSRAPPA
jgi:hypothetical protein